MAGSSRIPSAAAGIALLAMILAGPARGAVPPEGTPVVKSVSFQVASPYLVSYDEVLALVKIRPGDPLTESAVRESIRGLYAKPVFREVSAYVREEGGKADLLFYLNPFPVVTEIEAKGQKEVSAAQILSASRIRRSSPLEGRDFREAEDAVKKALKRKGFTHASVSVSVSCALDSGSGKVRIDVAEGPPARVRSIELPGASFFPPGKLAEMLGVAVGSPFDTRRWEEGFRSVRVAYKKAGFLTVHLAEIGLTCEDDKEMCLAARVDEGPWYEVEWAGKSAFPVSRREEAAGLYGEEETTEGGLVHDVRERLLTFYRNRDYSLAEVSVETEEKAGPVRVLKITIDEGKPVYLKEVRFEGNVNIPSGRLRKQMTTEKRGTFSLLTGSGKIREESWNEDMAAIVGLYQSEGFVRARITSVDNVWDEHGGLVRTIHVEEGPRYRLREIRFRGNDHFPGKELLDLMRNREGNHVDYVGLERDQEAIASHYRNAGYLDVVLRSRLDLDEGKDTAAARFDIEEGPRYVLGKVLVRGNQLTDPVVILRELGIPEGSPAGENDLLKFQQAIFRTGLYKSVRVQKLKRPSEGILDLSVEVEETLFFEVEYGAGYGSDTGIRGFVGARHRNLDTKGRNFYTRLSASQKEQKYIWELREPWIFGPRWKWEGGLTGYYQEADRKSFSLRKASLVASINKNFFDRSSFAIQYEVSRDHVFNVAPDAVLSPEDQGTANIAAGRVLVVLDLRDDPFNPRHGSLNSGTFELASYYFGSEVDYWKVAGQSSWYFPLFRKNTFVFSARAGSIRQMRDTVEVPIQKRFFLGGRTTVRGFKEETLGPLGADGTPTGGNYMLNLNTELRVPLQYGFVVAVFMDAGSVWIDRNPGSDFDLRKTAGLGLRYVTPVGPIALDYGWKLDRRTGETGSEWHFTIGSVF